MSYPSVTLYLRGAVVASSNPPAPLPQPKPYLDGCDHAIILVLADQPILSVRELSQLTHLPRTTVHRRLAKSLGFHVCRLRWVSHLWSRAQKLNRAIVSLQFLLCWNEKSGDPGTTLWLSMSHSFMSIRTMNSRGVSRTKRFPKESVTFSRKSDVHNSLELPRLSLNQCSAKRIQIQCELLVTQILGPLSD
jgi:hypothetical protein